MIGNLRLQHSYEPCSLDLSEIIVYYAVGAIALYKYLLLVESLAESQSTWSTILHLCGGSPIIFFSSGHVCHGPL